MEIFKDFRIEAAHRLIHVPDGHPCGRGHGHQWRIRIYVKGDASEKTGWIMDFADIKKAFQPIHDRLDHGFLNEVPGLENPTCEIIARWMWRELHPALPGLSRILIRETDTSGCIYQGEEVRQ